jgi:hypothetical protein
LSHCGIHAVVLGRLRLSFHGPGQHVMAGPLHHSNPPLGNSNAHVLFPPGDSPMASQEWIHGGKPPDSCRFAFQRRHASWACSRSLPRDPRGGCL